MIAALLALGLLVAQDPLAEVDRLRGERRFAEALERSAAITDAATRHRARLNVLYYAGDLAEALEEARAGLGHEPQDVWLLYYGARLALDLRRADDGERLARSLASAVAAGTSLTDEQRAFYAEAASELEARATALFDADERRSSALLRARAVVVAGVLATVASLLILRRGTKSRDDVSAAPV